MKLHVESHKFEKNKPDDIVRTDLHVMNNSTIRRFYETSGTKFF